MAESEKSAKNSGKRTTLVTDNLFSTNRRSKFARFLGQKLSLLLSHSRLRKGHSNG